MRTSRRRVALIMGLTVGVVAGGLGLGGWLPGIANASPSPLPNPPQNVNVSNDSTHPVPVAGTVNVGNLPGTQSISGTVGIDPNNNSVTVTNLPSTQQVSGTLGIDPNHNTVNVGNSPTVNLDPTSASHLASIDSTVGKLQFASDGRLLTEGQAPPTATFAKNCDPASDIPRNGLFECDFGRTVEVTHLGVRSDSDHTFIVLLSPSLPASDGLSIGAVTNTERNFEFSTPVAATGVQILCTNPTDNCAADSLSLGVAVAGI